MDLENNLKSEEEYLQRHKRSKRLAYFAGGIYMLIGAAVDYITIYGISQKTEEFSEFINNIGVVDGIGLAFGTGMFAYGLGLFCKGIFKSQ